MRVPRTVTLCKVKKKTFTMRVPRTVTAAPTLLQKIKQKDVMTFFKKNFIEPEELPQPKYPNGFILFHFHLFSLFIYQQNFIEPEELPQPKHRIY